ncbi:MAG: hypothetical protein ACREVR_11315, partial [Burkholderiales bacterium]
AEVFTGSPGKFVALKDTIRGFKAIIAGEHDNLPEQAFYMVGGGAVEGDRETPATPKGWLGSFPRRTMQKPRHSCTLDQ